MVELEQLIEGEVKDVKLLGYVWGGRSELVESRRLIEGEVRDVKVLGHVKKVTELFFFLTKRIVSQKQRKSEDNLTNAKTNLLYNCNLTTLNTITIIQQGNFKFGAR